MRKGVRLSDFEGRWQLEKTIRQAGAPEARFSGEAVWARDGQGLSYAEHGQLTLAGHAPLQSERRYLWRAPLDVLFEDGRFFHSVPPQGGEARHWCAPDDYRVNYRFEDGPRFETAWRVTGPRKTYTMLCQYVRYG